MLKIKNIADLLQVNGKGYIRLQIGDDPKKATWYEPFVSGWLLCSDALAISLENIYQSDQAIEADGPKH